MTYLDYLEQKILLERLVIGLEEPVLVKGLGELQAKIDSGNGGYNVIHGTDFHQQGDVLMFTTHDSFGHEKKISAKIIDDIEINMGGGNIEKRPVIELDIKFAGEDYKKIPFSVSDRSSNTHPILVSKGFVENELEALIDVGAKNISNDGVDVVYGESFLKPLAAYSPIKKGINKVGEIANKVANNKVVKWVGDKGGAVGKGVGNLIGDVKRGAQTVGNVYNRTLNGITNFGNWLKGDVKMSDWVPSRDGMKEMGNQLINGLLNVTGLRRVYKFAKKITFGFSFNGEDQIKIREAFKKSQEIKKIFPHATTTNPIPIVNFAFQKGKIGSKKIIKGMEEQHKKFKQAIKISKEAIHSRNSEYYDKQMVSNSQSNANSQTNAESSEKLNTENFEIFEKSLKLLIEDSTQVPVQDNKIEIDSEVSLTDEEIKQMEIFFNDLSQFFLWFCPIDLEKELEEKQKELNMKYLELKELNLKGLMEKHKKEIGIKIKKLKNAIEKSKNVIEKLKNNYEDEINKLFIDSSTYDGVFAKFFNIGKVNPNTLSQSNIIRTLSNILNKSKTGIKGVFCLAYNKNNEEPFERQYVFFLKGGETVRSVYQQDEETYQQDEETLWIKNKIEHLKNKNIL